MKREFCLSCLWGAVLGTALSFACAGCVATAFDLDTGSMVGLFLVCGLFSAAGAVCFRFKWGGAALMGALALLTGFLLRRTDALSQTCGVVETISRIYNQAYGWGYLHLDGSDSAAFPMAVIGVMVALAVSGTVSTGKSAWLPVTASLLPLFLCFVVTDTVPDEGYLFTLMAVLGVLILTSSVRMKAPGQGNVLTALVAVPVLLALAVLFLLNPQKDYVNRSDEFQKKVAQWIEHLPQRLTELPQLWEEMNDGGALSWPQDQAGEVLLENVGPRKELTYRVMDISGNITGTLYLRGQDFDFYSGTSWSSASRQGEDFPGSSCPLRSGGEITVRTRRLRDVLYLPYYCANPRPLISGRLYNTEGLTEYGFSLGKLPQDWEELSVGQSGAYATAAQLRADDQAKDLYLNLPAGTREQARELLQTLSLEGLSRTQKAERIAAFVRNSAEYDLNTPKMPGEQDDFALWFLKESDTGYCVHFATAAAVLLRAADIPARYVTGYLTEAVSGETVTVTAGDAHAWVEYYEPVLDAWIVLEATPSDGIAPETRPADTQPVPTATESTMAATEPTASQTEETPEPTQPTQVPTEEPTPEAPRGPDAAMLPGWLSTLLSLILIIGGLLLAVTGQRMLRLELKNRRFREDEPNTLALKLWREAVILARLQGQERPPRELEKLAQKAKYSQHTLTEAELSGFDAYLEESVQALKECPWYKQLLYRYLYVIY